MNNIAVVAGGYSSEYPISLQSGAMLVKEVSKIGYQVNLVEISPEGWFAFVDDNTRVPILKDDFSFVIDGNKHIFDAVVMAIHGTPGEDGKLEGYFDLLKIPYTCCGVLASALTFNKFACKTFVQQIGVDTAEAILIKKSEDFQIDRVIRKIGIPCIVKPNESGSSFGVSLVLDQKDLTSAIDSAIDESDEIVIEKYIKGIEVSCGMVSFPSEDIIFPITEIVSKNNFFDYQAKYTTGLSEEITPARIDPAMAEKIRRTTQNIYHALNCKGITRTDYIISDGRAFFLEVNTVPGMSPNSIVPKQLKTMNIEVSDMYRKIINQILQKR
jgi:D-alanine-D-alanine ligase